MYLLKRLLQVKKIDGIVWNCSRFSDQEYADLYSYNYNDENNLKKLARIRKLLAVQDVEDYSGNKDKYVRIGKNNDGGYVMLNDFDGVTAAYSFGICNDVSWDTFFAERGIDIYQYDHTIKRLPKKNKRFQWKKIGVCGKKNVCDNMDTLRDLVLANGHEKTNRMLLKMDIEGWEWDVFSETDEDLMNRFDQIVCEFHYMYSIDYLDRIIASLERINRTHQLVHIHANNGRGVLKTKDFFMPCLLEVTYVNRANRTFCDSDRFFPTSVDQKNCEYLPDIPLGYWN